MTRPDLRTLVPSGRTLSTLGTFAAIGSLVVSARAVWPFDQATAIAIAVVAAWLVFLAVYTAGMERPDRLGTVLRYLASRAGNGTVTVMEVMRATGAPSGQVCALLARLEREQYLVTSREVTDVAVGPGRRNVLRVYHVPDEAATTLRGLADNQTLRALTLGERHR